ncbi:insulinase family protein [Rhodocytophaga rosea]|uniref:Insulinase family protein n=1 Tax=Rhodocytophaga rosea TaxID=2704465 RepID=A0A6C0GHR5_9BACT|nr:pitrilysin family protein [Rhodocytophaga rosea]QHT67250.1 insulinase family protein [Rhodocytophaga rosea]
MKRIYYILYGLLCLFITTNLQAQKETPPPGGKPKDFKLPAKKVTTLDNGLKASLVPYGAVPKVTVSLQIQTGNVHEKADEVWLADLTGNLMKEGTTSQNAQAISEAAARMGGDVNIFVGPASTTISGSVLAEYAPDLIKLMADIVQHPAFPASEVDRLKNDLQRQLKIQQSQPQSQAQAKFAAMMYPDHPYGRFFPTEDMIKSYDLAKIKSFYEQNFGAQRSRLYVVGKFDENAVNKAIKESLTGWTKGPERNIPVPKPASKQEVTTIDRPNAPQSTIIIGLPVIDPSNPDYLALSLTNDLLGGSFGSRITSNIRENKGYTYSPSSSVASRYRSATWAEQADVTTEHTEASLKEIFYEINKLQAEAPGKEELEGIKNYKAGIFVLQNSSHNGIINQLSFLDLHGLDESYLTNYVKNIYAITPEKVQEIAQKYIREEDMTLVVVGDRKKVDSQIKSFTSEVNKAQSTK